MKTCENCGCAVYSLGCVNCDEMNYIEEQDAMTERDYVKLEDGSIEHRGDYASDKIRRFEDVVPDTSGMKFSMFYFVDDKPPQLMTWTDEMPNDPTSWG